MPVTWEEYVDGKALCLDADLDATDWDGLSKQYVEAFDRVLTDLAARVPAESYHGSRRQVEGVPPQCPQYSGDCRPAGAAGGGNRLHNLDDGRSRQRVGGVALAIWSTCTQASTSKGRFSGAVGDGLGSPVPMWLP